MVGNLNFITDIQINSNSLSALSLLLEQSLAPGEGSSLTSGSLCEHMVNQLTVTTCACGSRCFPFVPVFERC